MSLGTKRVKYFMVEAFDLLVFLILVFGIVLFIRLFIATPYTVIGSSMSPNFEEGDRIIVEKFTQRFSTFNRGDVIVFVAQGKESPYIKRIIGLPGETVLVQDGGVYICSPNNPSGLEVKDSEGNGCEILPEAYLPEGLTTTATCGKSEFKVEGGYFVMGDNRGRTTDSLCCFSIQCTDTSNYIVADTDLIGKVRVRLFPSYTKF